jgi:FixJ family two-component response regulator
MKEGASGFLTKPVQEDQLISTVEGLIDPVKPKGRPALRVPVQQD